MPDSAQSQKSAVTPPARRWRFGNSVFDERTLELTVNGEPIQLESKPLEVLRLLLHRGGELVSRDDLSEACWPGRILSDSVLSKTLSKLREALRDEGQTLIKTVHGYGYRLVVPVYTDAPAPLPAEPAAQAQPTAPPQQAASKPAPGLRKISDAERRQITVLFCDLVGSTRLSQQLDPEVFRELLLSYQQTVSESVERYEGHIAQYLGDGLMIYFGHPLAHEDDAERAVRAGYDILAAIRRLKQPLEGSGPISARIGIHTGSVIIGQVGSGEKQEMLALGETVNIAARLHALAEPDAIIISDATLKLVPGMFVTRDLGEQTLKGVDKPARVHQVLQPSGVRTRLEAAASLTPFVGRESELSLLTDRWNQAAEGHGQACLITAEAGLGKSRLLLTLRERIQDSPHTWLECRASQLTRNSAFHPVAELLARGLSIQEGDPPETRLQRLEQGLDAMGLDKQEAVPLLAPLLNLKLPERYPPSDASPELKRRRSIENLVTWTLALAKLQPLVLAFEDLHWADPSTLELLGKLLEQAPTGSMLVVLTARPEFTPVWDSPISTLSLQPLRSKDIGAMLSNLTRQKTLPEPVRDRVLKQAGGVPLFLEELIKSLLESGQLIETEQQLELAGPLDSLAIPGRLQDLLMARLDRQGAAKPLAQLCAVIGWEIPYKLLAAVAELDETELEQQLRQLIQAQLLYPRGSLPHATYVFKHALIGDAAYESLLKSTRQKLHGKIAGALESRFPEKTKTEPEVLARHFEKAGDAEKAVKYYKQAAENAAGRTANGEAIQHGERALKLLGALPETAQRHRLELDLLLTLSLCRVAVFGYGHTEVESTLNRATELRTKVDDPALLTKALAKLWMMHLVQADYRTALQLAEQLRALAKKININLLEAAGSAILGWTHWPLGQLTQAHECLEYALGLHDDASSKATILHYGTDGISVASVAASAVLWLLGYPDRALRQCREAVARAEALGHAYTMGQIGSMTATWIPLLCRMPEGVIEASTATIELAKRYGFTEWQAHATKHLAIAFCMLGRFEEGLPLLQQVLAAQRSRRTLMRQSHYYGMEAELCLAAGRLHEARTALGQAFEIVEAHNERFWEAELHRVMGELLLAEMAAQPVKRLRGREPPQAARPRPNAPNTAAAEACFREALDIARKQAAKSLELRAAVSLARLWHTQNRRQQARELLQPVYAWFTEGFGTPDLRDARTLLDQLGA